MTYQHSAGTMAWRNNNCKNTGAVSKKDGEMLQKSKLLFVILVGLTALIFSFLTTMSSFAAYPEGVISHWKLDETTPGAPNGTYADSFNGNHGTGDANPASTAGIVGGGQYFSAESTGINVPADSSFNWLGSDSFSMEFWAKIDTGIPVNNQVFMGRYIENSSEFVFWFIGIEGGTGLASFILIDSDNISGGVGGTTGTISLADGQWHHVAAVRDDSNNTNLIYTDGILQDSVVVDYTGDFLSIAAEINIGWFDFLTFFRFRGSIDEIALYDRALTETEIQQHYAAGLLGQGIEDLVLGPSAEAGPDQIVFDEITLDGSLSNHPAGQIISYQWQLTHRENTDFNRTAAGINPTVSNLKRGFYDVSLVVEDSQGKTGSDQMFISAYGPKGDFDFDGDVDGYDLSIFLDYFGATE